MMHTDSDGCKSRFVGTYFVVFAGALRRKSFGCGCKWLLYQGISTLETIGRTSEIYNSDCRNQ